MTARGRQFRVAVALAAALTAHSGSGLADDAQPPRIEVELTNSACQPDEFTAPAGRVAFSVHNSTSAPLEWEILDGVMVIEERENIPPGERRSLTARLAAGDYAITCGLIGNPRGALHVIGQRGVVLKVRKSEIIGPLAEYRVFVSDELDSLIEAMQRLVDAVAAGRIEQARQLYMEAHAHYVRISPVAMYFPDLDGAVDTTLKTLDAQKMDPSELGFNQLRWDLFEAGDLRLCVALLSKLSTDLSAMRTRFESLPMTPTPTLAGAAQTIGAASPPGSAGWRGHVELSDFRASVEGVRKVSDLFRPLIARVDAELGRRLGDDFSALDVELARMRTQDGGEEGEKNRALAKALVRKLAEELGRAPSALGLS